MNKRILSIIRFILGFFILYIVGVSDNFFRNPKVNSIFNILCIFIALIVFPKIDILKKITNEWKVIDKKIILIYIIGGVVGFISLIMLILYLN
ncbi:MAG: hypothetical protein GX275_04965 [Clostridiales bacterium]|nr:hypothetical protein [Clostridiales bacterium]